MFDEIRFKSLLPASCNGLPRWELPNAKCDNCSEVNCPSPSCSCDECRKDVISERLWFIHGLIETQKSLIGLRDNRRQIKSMLTKNPFMVLESAEDRQGRANLTSLVNEHIKLKQYYCQMVNPHSVECLP